MRRCVVRCFADPALIVQKRLPWQVRKQQLKDNLWQEDKEEAATERLQTPGVVVSIAQAAKKRERTPKVWANLLNQALARQEDMTPQDMASVLWSMAEARFQHQEVLDEFVRSLSFWADVKAMVTAILALDRLGLPTDVLRGRFMQQLSGTCDDLSFGDLRRVLMALARCWKATRVHPEILDELCNSIVVKAEGCDSRNLVAVPQHLGRLRYPHAELLAKSGGAVEALVKCRLKVLPLDLLRACDGLLLLAPLMRTPESREGLLDLADKCALFVSELMRDVSHQVLWADGAQLLAAEVVEQRVWSPWATEVLRRRPEGVGPAQRLQEVRKRIARRWQVQVPEGLESALRRGVRDAMRSSSRALAESVPALPTPCVAPRPGPRAAYGVYAPARAQPLEPGNVLP